MYAVSPSKAFPPQGGRWHGEAVTDEGASLCQNDSIARAGLGLTPAAHRSPGTSGRGKPRPYGEDRERCAPHRARYSHQAASPGTAGAYYAPLHGPGRKRKITVPPSRKHQVQTRDSAPAEITRRISGSGVRRGSAQKHSPAALPGGT